MSSDIVNGIFALAGAVAGVAGTWFVTHRFKERKRIAVIVSPLAQMLDIGDQVRSDVQITFRGRLVEQLSMGELALQNTGNVPIESLDATLTCSSDSQFVDFCVSSTNFSTGDEGITVSGDEKTKTIRLNFLNANDRAVFNYKLAGARSTPNVVVRKLGVEVATKRDYVGWIPDIYAEVVFQVFSEMPLFKLFGFTFKPYRLYLESKKNRAADGESD